jgi:hypothetical protein
VIWKIFFSVPALEAGFLKHLRSLYRRFQRSEAFFHKADTPAQLFFRGQLRLSHRIVKLASAQNPTNADLRRDIGKAGNYDYGNSFFLDFFPDRSAATCAGSSGGG